MNGKWKRAKAKVDAVQAFDSLERGGYQRPDERYNPQDRVQPPDDGPPPHVQQQISQYGQSASYYNAHPQSTVSSPFVAKGSPPPFQYSPHSSPPQQSQQYFPHSSPPQQQQQYSPHSSPPQQYSPHSSPPQQYSPHSSAPQQYSPHMGNYGFPPAQPTYAAQQNTVTGAYAPVQGSPPPVTNYNISNKTPQEQNRGLGVGNEDGPRYWNNCGPTYGQYQQPQRSATMHGYQNPYDQVPDTLYRSSTMPTSYGSHNCADHRSAYDGSCLICHPAWSNS